MYIKLNAHDLQYSKKKKIEGPSKEYELLRRRIYFNTKEFWYYVSYELRLLARTVKGIKPITIQMMKNINEQYLSLLNDIDKLATVDDHAQWRRKEYIYLRTLVQKRLRFLQNPEDCSKAKKLFCNLISVNINAYKYYTYNKTVYDFVCGIICESVLCSILKYSGDLEFFWWGTVLYLAYYTYMISRAGPSGPP